MKELAALYTAAEVFFNPTFEDNYPSTNIESIACGTPVITYDTGGSPESACMYGLSVAKNDIKKVVETITSKEKITAEEIEVGENKTVEEYLKLYEALEK